jgi:ribosomal protein S11
VAKDPESAAAPAAKPAKRKKEFRKKREKRVVPHGVVCIQATFNNTIVTLTDPDGRAVSWASAGSVGFKGSRKGTPYAAQQAAMSAAGVARDQYGMKSVEVRVKAHQRDQGRHARSAQRLPSSEAPPRVTDIRRARRVVRPVGLEKGEALGKTS